ncbi:MAG: hypothetical protein GQ474_05960 [Sulfurimonas sp.]|nr:hypothetical protein [Sulfurimonas sp.]
MSMFSSLSTVVSAGQTIKTFRNIRDDFDNIGDVLNGSAVGTFSKSGLTDAQYKKSLLDHKQRIEELQHADVFRIDIQRVEPFYDREKSEQIVSMVKSVTIVHDGLETEETRMGSGYFNWHKGRQSGEVQAVFHEFEDSSTMDFLTRVSAKNVLSGKAVDLKLQDSLRGLRRPISAVQRLAGGIGIQIPNIGATIGALGSSIGGGSSVGQGKHGNIMPSDGTTLLPYEYYFRIRVSSITNDLVNNQMIESVVLEDDFIIDGNVSQEYSTGDERYLELSVTFKPIKSWR